HAPRLRAFLGKPVGQGGQVARTGPEVAYLLTGVARRVDPTHAGDDGLLVDVKSGAATVEDVHDGPPGSAPPWRASNEGTIYPACSPASGGDSFRFVATPRSHCSAGSKHQATTGLRPGPKPQAKVRGADPSFIVSGCRAAA